MSKIKNFCKNMGAFVLGASLVGAPLYTALEQFMPVKKVVIERRTVTEILEKARNKIDDIIESYKTFEEVPDTFEYTLPEVTKDTIPTDTIPVELPKKVLLDTHFVNFNELYEDSKSMDDNKIPHPLLKEIEIASILEKKHSNANYVAILSSSVMNDVIENRGYETVKPPFEGVIEYYKGKFKVRVNKIQEHSFKGSLGAKFKPEKNEFEGRLYKKGNDILASLDDDRSVLLLGKGLSGAKVDDMYVKAGQMDYEKNKILGTIVGKTLEGNDPYRLTRNLCNSLPFAKTDKVSDKDYKRISSGKFVKF